ncbi:MAG: Asp-tRNA(Asn)/Glu-tRNA(Gln) amidotransferase subunit GatC [Lautropia sp.]|nr:MAG: Asp-tRNA(Asn)/Glu-tRNA(Gln) amidotransferase subunit GatC [Pseudomonadota bacterium]MBC6959911.1 Asp-tRNA(Asn)/Glu-tRNA(Gln) amidotransferase subunit GatC [Lautropia sp.]MCL4700764.1 Asp-tRNA(Asn)/Glu-tRNA(Gln) amidotransferase subunit GatC [Burkholderiaceae bacterium]MCZ2415344.1 Asp-tRNA(Asn)/Glu-tRNA(Gln) amidotransferase subunit GatC [Burkholderiales bacterium]MDL1908440.1 Asp-tRNA(Asn)/Glu-tRNA(Gln) amidotransferase subunit GatC [Betaproteobacteria bacterium PRO1]
MSLTLDDVQRIAMLARIGLGEQEAVRTCAQLEAVFGLIEQLQSVDTRGVEPMTHPGEAGLRLRDDVADEPQRREEYQAVAPSVERGLYLVPRVIE